ncbi:MAG: tetratricopeptide repeat protein [bacterium]|nr:tetratricopeptide repeat protein [bacterium]
MAKRMFEKGKVFFLKKKWTKAMNGFQQCLESYPKYSQADYFLSQIYYNQGDYIKAQEHIDKAKANYSTMANLLIASQQKYMETLRERRRELQDLLGDVSPRESEPIKKSISEIDSRLNEPIPVMAEGSAEYFYFHGNILMKLKKFNNAHAQYIQALKLNPKHGSASNNLANLYYMVKKYEKALEYLNQAEANGVKINPKFKAAILKAIKK